MSKKKTKNKRVVLDTFLTPKKKDIEFAIGEGYIVLHSIKWDKEGEKVDLPKAVIIPKEMFEADHDFNENGADFLSDRYGWCVKSFVVEK